MPRTQAWGLLWLALLAASCVGRASPLEIDGPDAAEDALKTPDPEDAAPEVVDGPAITPPAELLAWLESEGRGAVVQLPVTVTVSPLGMGPAYVGSGPEPAPDAVHLKLDDGALGIALADRLRQQCPAGGPCAVWLEGRWGAHVTGPADPIGGPSLGPGGPSLEGMMPGPKKHPFAVSRVVGPVEGSPARIRRVR